MALIEIDGLPNLKIVMFYSSVSLPEGNWKNMKIINVSEAQPDTLIEEIVH